MAVRVNNSEGLFYDSGINLEGIERDVKKMQAILEKEWKEALKKFAEMSKMPSTVEGIEKVVRVKTQASIDVMNIIAREGKVVRQVADDWKLLLQAYNDAALKYKNYVAVTGDLTGKHAQDLLKQANAIKAVINATNEGLGNYQHNVGAYSQGITKSFNSIRLQTSQLMRELPNAGISMQTFIMSLSNNLPYFFEAIQMANKEIAAVNLAIKEAAAAAKLKAEADALAAGASKKAAAAAAAQAEAQMLANTQASKAPSIWKMMGSSIFGVQGLLIVGVTLLTAYGKKIADWVGELFKGKDALAALKKEQEEFKKLQSDAYNEAGKQIGQLQSLNAVLISNTASAKAKKGAYDQLVKLYPSYADQLNDEYKRTGQVAGVIRNVLIPAIVAAANARAMQARIDKISAENLTRQDEMNKLTKEENSLRQQAFEQEKKREQRRVQITGSTTGAGGTGFTVNVWEETNAQADKVKNKWKEVAKEQGKATKVLENYAKGLAETNDALGNLTSGGIDAGRYISKEKKKKDATDETNASLKKRADLLHAISESAEKFTYLDKQENEISKINDFFDDLAYKVKKYNDDKKNKIKLGFDDIEKNRTEALQKYQHKLAKDQVNELSKSLSDQFKKEVAEKIKTEESAYKQILDKSKDYEQQRINIEGDLINQLNGLERKRTSLTLQEYSRQKKVIQDNYNDRIRLLKVTESRIIKMLGADLNTVTDEALSEIFRAFSEAIKSGKMENGAKEMVDIPPDVLNRLNQAREGIIRIREENKRIKDSIDWYGSIADNLSRVSDIVNGISQSLNAGGFGDSPFADVMDGMGKMLTSFSEGYQMIDKIVTRFNAVKADMNSSGAALKDLFKSNDWIAAVIKIIGIIINLFGAFKKYKQAVVDAQRDLEASTVKHTLAEYDLSEELRKQNLIKAESLELTLKQLEATKKMLEENKKQTNIEAGKLLAELQKGQFLQNTTLKGRSWIAQLFGGKPKELKEYASLANMSFEQINRLFLEGRLEGKELALFQQLQKIKQEGIDIDQQLKDLQNEANEVFTATTSNAILDSIVNGFKEGKRSAADFADTFEDLMRDAMLNSLKYQYLEMPLQDWYKEFAQAASDGMVDSAEKALLNKSFQDIIAKGGEAAKMMEQVTGLTSNSARTKNSFSGSIQQITQQQADVLTGQFYAQTTVLNDINNKIPANFFFDSLGVMDRQFEMLSKIENNTGNTVNRLDKAVDSLKSIDSKMSNRANEALAAGFKAPF